MKKYYFMAGLPRSGSTLLSAILNQNPKFYSGPSSPVTGMMLTMEQYVPTDELYNAFPKPKQVGNLISNIINFYYDDIDKEVIFDKNRSWVNRINYIPGYFNIEPKIICPVRNIDEILTSFLSMHKRNPYEVGGKINFMDEMLIKSNIPLTDENRCEFLASPNGILGQSYFGIQEALNSEFAESMHFVEYNDLINNPEETMKKIYEFLGEDYFEHDFSKIENINQENDAQIYGFKDMHELRSKINKVSADPKEILPERIYDMAQGQEFWRDYLANKSNINNKNFIGV